MKKHLIQTVFAAALVMSVLSPAIARAQNADPLPPQAAESAATTEYELSPDDDTHPMLRLTPDKSDIVRLDADASSVIVGNPTHLSVLLDNARTLVLVPRDPGATRFTILDKSGRIVMQRHVIVASPKQDYVRIRRSCAGVQGNCQPVSVYYCPDMCHQVNILDSSRGEPQIDNSGRATNLNETLSNSTQEQQPQQEAEEPVEQEPAQEEPEAQPEASTEEAPAQ